MNKTRLIRILALIALAAILILGGMVLYLLGQVGGNLPW